jgi:hypothetical protein
MDSADFSAAAVVQPDGYTFSLSIGGDCPPALQVVVRMPPDPALPLMLDLGALPEGVQATLTYQPTEVEQPLYINAGGGVGTLRLARQPGEAVLFDVDFDGILTLPFPAPAFPDEVVLSVHIEGLPGRHIAP